MSNCGNIDDLKENIYRDINMQMNMRNREWPFKREILTPIDETV